MLCCAAVADYNWGHRSRMWFKGQARANHANPNQQPESIPQVTLKAEVIVAQEGRWACELTPV